MSAGADGLVGVPMHEMRFSGGAVLSPSEAQVLVAGQRIAPAAIVRCEALWLKRAGLGAALDEMRSAFERSKQVGSQYYVDELGYWLWLHGLAVDGVDPTSPRGLQVAGRWREAAQA